MNNEQRTTTYDDDDQNYCTLFSLVSVIVNHTEWMEHLQLLAVALRANSDTTQTAGNTQINQTQAINRFSARPQK